MCGLKYKVQTDHKPLIPLINKKDIIDSPLRCQRLIMRLAKYDVLAEYIPGKYLVVADALSRLPTSNMNEKPMLLSIKANDYAENMVTNLPASNQQLERLKSEQRNDRIIRNIIEYTFNEWPEINRDDELFIYFIEKANFSVVSGLLLYHNRIVIPHSLRKEMLSKIHDTGHLSLNKCRERIKISIWWPGIPSQLKKYIETCHFCQINRRQQRNEPM